jgi:hypothetical protein
VPPLDKRRGSPSPKLAAGKPVCSPDDFPAAVAGFEAFGRSRNCHVCYVGATESMRELLAASANHSAIAIGAQPVWNPADWPRIVRTRRSVRAQLNRSINKGVHIETFPPADAAHNPGIDRVLSDWLRTRRLPPMHFLVEPEVLAGTVDGRLLLLARREGRIVAFLVAAPVAARNGFLIELLARSPRPRALSRQNVSGRLGKPLRHLEPEVVLSAGPLCGGRRFSGISPVRAIALAIVKGAREELRTLHRKLNK